MSKTRTMLVAERVYLEIKNKILSGEYLPGTHLVEADLTEEFKTSRITLRDALRRLAADDLVEIIPNSGCWVRKFTYCDVVEHYLVREPLEGLAARLAAQAPVQKLQELQRICAESALAVSRKDTVLHRQLNNQFHQALALATGNRTLIKMIERLNIQMIGNQFMTFMRDENIQKSQLDHEQMVEAILAGDGEKAEQIMRSHIRRGHDFALKSLHILNDQN